MSWLLRSNSHKRWSIFIIDTKMLGAQIEHPFNRLYLLTHGMKPVFGPGVAMFIIVLRCVTLRFLQEILRTNKLFCVTDACLHNCTQCWS